MTNEIQITPAPYKHIDTHYTSEGSCIDCGMGISVGYRYYRNLETKEEVSSRFRSACDCSPDSDPYECYAEPMPRWSHPGQPHHPEGQYLWPKWNKEMLKWDMLPQD